MRELLVLLIFLLPLYAGAKDCSSVKTGSFKIIDESFDIRSTVKRKKKVQIEKFGSYTIKNKVEWISDCTYKLTLIKTDLPETLHPENAEVIVQITEVKEDRYEAIVSSNFSEQTFSLTMIRID